ncbi:dihydroneopterin aldolase [bacterium]|nr:dihydroneopterin aldolase [bacterium]
MKDSIIVEGLVLRMTLGVEDWERREPQDVLVDYEIGCDLLLAGRTDKIEDTLNYRTVNKAVLALAEQGGIHTAERLAALIAKSVLSFAGAASVTVRVTKPGALRFADSVAVEIHRKR